MQHTHTKPQCKWPVTRLSGLGSEAELGHVAVEDDELRLEEDVAVDGEPDAGVGLDATEASCESWLANLG